ncbi:MAG: four helix bundle protein [Bacteroidetes bacterium]|nr:four helix bundle protein [Bacteroidota bacterium]
MNTKRNELVEVSFEFALLIIDFAEELEKLRKYVIAKQLLKSGTSVGANINEAQSAESKADFIHKLKIAHKELLETEYWIKLVKSSSSYPKPNIEIENRLTSLKKLFNKIISTAKK